MSTRAMGRLYGSMASGGAYGMGGNRGGGDGPSLLSQLFGQSNVSMPEVKTMPDGSIQVIPAQGSKGIFGGWSRAKAMEMNAPLLLQQLAGLQGIQQTKEQGKQERETAQAASLNKLAEQYGIDPKDMPAISQSILALAQQQIANQRYSTDPLTNPDILGASNMGANIAASRFNPTDLTKMLAGPGQVQAVPNIPGMNFNTLRGPLPTSNTTVVPTKMMPGANGQMTPYEFAPVTKQGYSSMGGFDKPVSQDILDQAAALGTQPPQGVQPAPPNPSVNMDNYQPTYPDERAAQGNNPVRTMPPVQSQPSNPADAGAGLIDLLMRAFGGMNANYPSPSYARSGLY